MDGCSYYIFLMDQQCSLKFCHSIWDPKWKGLNDQWQSVWEAAKLQMDYVPVVQGGMSIPVHRPWLWNNVVWTFFVWLFLCSALCVWELSVLLSIETASSFGFLCTIPLYKNIVIKRKDNLVLDRIHCSLPFSEMRQLNSEKGLCLTKSPGNSLW